MTMLCNHVSPLATNQSIPPIINPRIPHLRGSLGFERHVGTFLLVVDGSFDFALGLQRRDDVLVLPANLSEDRRNSR